VATTSVLLAGCVSQGKPGLAVRQLQPVPPTADMNPQVDLGNGTVDILPPQPVQQTPSTKPRVIPQVPVNAASNPCPPAAEDAFPAQIASFSVTQPPQPGEYRWKETVQQPLGDGKTTATITQFLKHDIINVSPVTVTSNPIPANVANQIGTSSAPVVSFTYDEVIHNLDGSTTMTSYSVKDHEVNATVANPNGELPTNAPLGPPDRGLAITKVVQTSADGKTVTTFAPTTPVLLIPLDVAYPETFQSVGVAPDGTTMTVDANIVHRSRVDACGTIIDGWEVDSTQYFAMPGQTATPVSDNYYVATQLGAILTYESKTLPSQFKTATTPTIIDSIGQLHPDPLPKTGK
jgi:hypothetical protein